MLTLEQVKKIKWYRQSGAGIPLTIGMPFLPLGKRMLDRSGFHFPNDLIVLQHSDSGFCFYHYFDYYLALEEVKKIFSTFETKPQLFEQMKEDFYTSGNNMETLGRKLIDLPVNDPSFNTKYEEFLEYNLSYWDNSLYIDLLDPAENEVIDFIFADQKEKIGKKNINALMSPDKISLFQQQQKDLLEIFEHVKNNGLDQNATSLLKKHSEKYYWLKNDYEIVEFLDESFYKNEVQKLLDNPDEIDQITPGLRKFAQNQTQKQQIISEQSISDDILRKLHFFNWITSYRDDRKKFTQICNYILMTLAHNISKHLQIDINLIKYTIPNEISSLVSRDPAFLRDLEQRQKYGILTFADPKQGLVVTTGSLVEAYHTMIEQAIQASEIKGNTASGGKVIGNVKIILNQSDFSKMRKDDILVASMTRPEYVPIMKQASAIITDEGGITCHAAIISRELGIPCITGTQVATRSLQDGDLVDVNANHGLIKIIKKAKD